MNSPAVPGHSSIGRKAISVVNVEAISGHAITFADWVNASKRE